MIAQPPQQQLTFAQQLFRPISAPLLMKYGSERIIKVGIGLMVLGALFFVMPWIVGIIAMSYGWPWLEGGGSTWVFFGILFAGGIMMLIGAGISRMGSWAWMFELQEVSRYRPVSATGMLRYLVFGIKKDEVQRAKDDYYRPYYYPPPPPRPVVRKKVPLSHLCPHCRSKTLPGDNLCTACGETID
jgi:hypothetical protein